MTEIKNRSEIVFLYDVKDNNPNGDPLNENKPRIDEETGLNYVTDVRLKRTVRDFIALTFNQQAPNKVFMKAERKEDNTLKSITELTQQFNSIKELVENCIDIRLFGGTIAIKKDKNSKSKKDEAEEAQEKNEDSNAITGPVQFRIGRSLHRVFEKEDQITRTVPNDTGNKQGTFGYDQRLFYSLIKFYGVINENTAAHTKLSEEDVKKLLQAMWFGTKELNTRTKIGHTPRFLLKVDYQKGFFVGDLDSKIKLVPIDNKQDEQLRSPEDYKLDLTKLENVLNQYADKIENIYLAIHPDIELTKPFEINSKEIINLENQDWFNVYQTV